jgi:hypothetical protein
MLLSLSAESSSSGSSGVVWMPEVVLNLDALDIMDVEAIGRLGVPDLLGVGKSPAFET